MSGLSLEFHCWGSLLEGIVTFPYRLERIDIEQTKYKFVDRGVTNTQMMQISGVGYKLVDKGARKYDIIQYPDDTYKVIEVGTRYIDLIEYTDTQVYITPNDQVLEI